MQRFVAFKALFEMKVSIDNTENVNKNVNIFIFFLYRFTVKLSCITCFNSEKNLKLNDDIFIFLVP